MNDTKHTLLHGGIAVMAGVVGTAASLLPQIEQILRILVLLLTVVATALSIRKLIRGRRPRDGKLENLESAPLVGILALALLIGMILTGCSREAPGDITDPGPKQMEPIEQRAADGRVFRVVRRGIHRGMGAVSDMDLWQPIGAMGHGLPVYTRLLQATGDTADPIFTRAGVLE